MPYALLLVLLASCASPHPKRFDRPAWIENPLAYCGEQKLCAVGESDDYPGAESAGRAGLVKIFSTNVRADLDAVTSSEGDEQFSQAIRESSDMVIQGSQIEERFADSLSHYALASLDKSLGAKILGAKIGALDDEIGALSRTGRRGALSEALRLSHIRRALHEAYLVVRPTSIPPKVPPGILIAKKASLAKNAPVVSVEGEEPFRGLFVQALSKLGYKIAADSKSPADATVRLRTNLRRQYLNVEGFEKYTLSLTATGVDRKGKTTGSITRQLSRSGRSQEDTLDTMAQDIVKDIETQIDGLNLEKEGL